MKPEYATFSHKKYVAFENDTCFIGNIWILLHLSDSLLQSIQNTITAKTCYHIVTSQ